MSPQHDYTTNIPELTPINSDQCVQKSIQDSTITTVYSSVNEGLKTLIEHEATMSLNIGKITNTFFLPTEKILPPFLSIMLMLNRPQEVVA